MTTFGGDIHQIGLASVILHELGHNMGQVYADKNTDLTFGRPALKKIPGIGFPKDVSTGGVAYGGHEHQGTHCASGIANKAAVSFQNTIALNQHTCLMYGASDMESTFKYPFCDECKQYIKAEDLSDIRKYWA